jgi:diguanylate cyclase (GGDEF)-like protein
MYLLANCGPADQLCSPLRDELTHKERAVIDIKTFMLVLAIGNIGFALLMAGYARGAGDNGALRLWTCAKLVEGCAHLLGWLRPDLPFIAVTVAANTTLILGIALELAAYCSFFGVGRWKRILIPATLLFIAAFNGARFGGMAPAHLLVLMSAIIAVLTGAMAAILLRPGRGASLLQRIMGTMDFVFFAAMSLRGYSGLADGGMGVFTPGVMHTVTYLTGYLLLIVNGFGFLLLCKEKDDRKMALLATIDSLTGLLNRRAFFEQTSTLRTLAARLRKPVALMMLDIDHFKQLNDRHGHACGDHALCVFADTARGTLREHDIMGRLGGEEFALVLPGTDMAGAVQAAERLRQVVEAVVVDNDGEPFRMTVSIGVVLVDPNEHINAALARADRALYMAKSAGRNRIEHGDAILKCA